jgi:hypothetical protein
MKIIQMFIYVVKEIPIQNDVNKTGYLYEVPGDSKI